MASRFNFLGMIPDIQIQILHQAIMDCLTISFDAPAILSALEQTPKQLLDTKYKRKWLHEEAEDIWQSLRLQYFRSLTVHYSNRHLFANVSQSDLSEVRHLFLKGLFPSDFLAFRWMINLETIVLDFTNVTPEYPGPNYRMLSIGVYAIPAAMHMGKGSVRRLILKDRVVPGEERKGIGTICTRTHRIRMILSAPTRYSQVDGIHEWIWERGK